MAVSDSVTVADAPVNRLPAASRANGVTVRLPVGVVVVVVSVSVSVALIAAGDTATESRAVTAPLVWNPSHVRLSGSRPVWPTYTAMLALALRANRRSRSAKVSWRGSPSSTTMSSMRRGAVSSLRCRHSA